MGIGISKIQHVYGGSLSGLQNHKHQTQPHSHKKREENLWGEILIIKLHTFSQLLSHAQEANTRK